MARNCIANRRRTSWRRDRLIDVAATLERLAGPATGPDTSVVERAMLIDALTTLSELEREALLLVAWDGLDSTQAAAVSDCSRRAFEVRLSRARARLSRALDASDRLHPIGSRKDQP